MSLKVLLINPPFAEYGGLQGHGGKALPLNLAYLAAYLRQQKPSVEIRVLDCEALELRFEQVQSRIADIRPDLVGITAPTPAYAQVLEVCRRIKEIDPAILVVAGGPHPTVLSQETVAEPCIDVAVMGEGEITFTEVVDAFEKNSGWAGVNGIAYKDTSGRVCVNPPRPLIPDLDVLPFPARDLFPLERYFLPPTKHMSSKRPGNMITSRGCPYRCTYCIASVMTGRKVRLRGVTNVVDEIESCVKTHGIGEINFHDELFTLKEERTIEICREIRRRRLDIVWVCMIRVDYLSPRVLEEMRLAGCRKIMLGLETGSQMILDLMKKHAALEKAEEAVKAIKKAGIKTAANFMFGNIGETEQTIRQSINLAKKLNTDTCAFFVASPYPGTEFYRIAKERGYLRPDLKWKDFCLVSNNMPVMNLPGLSAERILKLQKQAYREYYIRWGYLIRKLAGIRSWTEIKNLLSGLALFLRISKGK